MQMKFSVIHQIDSLFLKCRQNVFRQAWNLSIHHQPHFSDKMSLNAWVSESQSFTLEQICNLSQFQHSRNGSQNSLLILEWTKDWNSFNLQLHTNAWVQSYCLPRYLIAFIHKDWPIWDNSSTQYVVQVQLPWDTRFPYFATYLSCCWGVHAMRRWTLIKFSTPAASCLLSAPIRLQKNSSKLRPEIAKNRSLCRQPRILKISSSFYLHRKASLHIVFTNVPCFL